MKRIITLFLFLFTVCIGHAQRYVVNVKETDGAKQRVDTRRVQKIVVSDTDDGISTTLDDGTTLSWLKEDCSSLEIQKLPPRLVHYVQSIETPQVHRYITETSYDPDDYEYTNVFDYNDPLLPLDRPLPLVIRIERGQRRGNEYVLLSPDASFGAPTRHELTQDSLVIWNLTPGDSLYYRIMEADDITIIQEGIASVTGQVRMIYAPSVGNFRDMGGWPVAGGGRVRYGRLFRGAKCHDANKDYVTSEDSIRLREIGIMCEFDLRGGTEAGGGKTSNYYSRLGRDVDYRIIGHGMYAYYNAVAVYPEYFRYGWNLIKAYIFNGYPIYIHCSQGCDRMGTWALVLEGLLGVSEDDLNHDYELSSFDMMQGRWRYRNIHQKGEDYDFKSTIGHIKSLPGETLRDKFEYFFVNVCGIPSSDVQQMREMLIER